jgi:hypothetical protein
MSLSSVILSNGWLVSVGLSHGWMSMARSKIATIIRFMIGFLAWERLGEYMAKELSDLK